MHALNCGPQNVSFASSLFWLQQQDCSISVILHLNKKPPLLPAMIMNALWTLNTWSNSAKAWQLVTMELYVRSRTWKHHEQLTVVITSQEKTYLQQSSLYFITLKHTTIKYLTLVLCYLKSYTPIHTRHESGGIHSKQSGTSKPKQRSHIKNRSYSLQLYS